MPLVLAPTVPNPPSIPMPLTSSPLQILFLPGALGRTAIWQAVADRLQHPAPRTLLGWPGFGESPADPFIQGFDDLVKCVVDHLDRPTALVAQSMGGAIALRATLTCPQHITHLVLAATSGGLDVAALGGQNWRPSLRAAQPHLPEWFADYHEDLTPRLASISAPTLLLWGDADPISPPSVGKQLARHLPRAQLEVLMGGDHDLAETHANQIAPMIDRFLANLTP
ncbi:MAG: alpha/beta fold hydrolase [Zoogloea sp.]|uniref:alpha/beta fold hydrolase n=1 Tax=Zoogloea sp. TaxID=49181 RepID=UPI003F2B71EB